MVILPQHFHNFAPLSSDIYHYWLENNCPFNYHFFVDSKSFFSGCFKNFLFICDAMSPQCAFCVNLFLYILLGIWNALLFENIHLPSILEIFKLLLSHQILLLHNSLHSFLLELLLDMPETSKIFPSHL